MDVQWDIPDVGQVMMSDCKWIQKFNKKTLKTVNI